VLV
ncbi:asnC-type helix-turn-helix domain protein, partial [Vibrio parahaemolyticus V-223/04]|jgi:hypothetical protein